jgi:hypothetical protein
MCASGRKNNKFAITNENYTILAFNTGNNKILMICGLENKTRELCLCASARDFSYNTLCVPDFYI